MTTTITKAYAALAKNYSLPPYKKLSALFGLEDIEHKENLLKNISQAIADRHKHYASVLEGIVQPDHSITSMHESDAFSETEKMQIIVLLKELMFIYREFSVLALDAKEASFAEFISRTYASWPKTKKQLVVFLKRLCARWEESDQFAPEISYLG